MDAFEDNLLTQILSLEYESAHLKELIMVMYCWHVAAQIESRHLNRLHHTALCALRCATAQRYSSQSTGAIRKHGAHEGVRGIDSPG